MRNAHKHRFQKITSRPSTVKTVRSVGVGLLVMACVQTGQLMHRSDTEAKQEKKIQALYIALQQEQAGLRENGQQPKMPNPSAILSTPGIILGEKTSDLAGGRDE